MKVLHVITTLENGGAENQLLILAKAQKAMGMDVEVLGLKGGNTLLSDFHLNGIKVHTEFSNRTFLIQRRMLKKLISNKKLVLHAHLPQAELLCAFVKVCEKDVTYIVTRHFGGAFKPKKSGLYSIFLSRFATLRSAHVIAISEAVKKYLQESHEISRQRSISVVYYGFDALDFQRKALNQKQSNLDILPDKNSYIFIGTIARLSEEKDLQTLLKGFAVAKSCDNRLKCVIAGSGPMRNELELLSEELGIRESVIFLGKINNVAAMMNEMDLIVLTSKFEGFGMVLVEAMALGKAIIGTNTTAIPEVIGNGGPGILINVGDFHGLADEIIGLTRDHKRKRDLEDLGLLWVQKFSVEKMVSQIYRIYTSTSRDK
jgi:glycosyltransferase involved in cell wall biosynthesis